jgi:hypothetical protein
MKTLKLILSVAVLFLTACNGEIKIGIENTPTVTSSLPATLPPAATDTTAPTNTPFPTFTPPPATLAPSDTPVPPATPAPTASLAPAATNTSVSNPAAPAYIDDRSTPSQIIISLYNAINRREYARAYDYWINPATSLGSFSSYANGYQNTASVDLVFGQITGDAGAGQMYFTVPVILKTTSGNGSHANFGACYIVHQSQPGFFSEPPFLPMGIDRGQASPAGLNASDTSVLANACNGLPAGATPVSTSGAGLNIDKSNYLDNRSGPVETVSSFLNALNLKQYARAYYYFQNPASFPGDFNPWSAGYSDTDTITVTFGTVTSEGAAGSLYYKVPLSTHVITSSNTTQTFVGCYTLRLGQPANQTVPPFQPLGITTGKFTQVANGTNVSALLPAACN